MTAGRMLSLWKSIGNGAWREAGSVRTRRSALPNRIFVSMFRVVPSACAESSVLALGTTKHNGRGAGTPALLPSAFWHGRVWREDLL